MMEKMEKPASPDGKPVSEREIFLLEKIERLEREITYLK
jgi:hypothetical protein